MDEEGPAALEPDPEQSSEERENGVGRGVRNVPIHWL